MILAETPDSFAPPAAFAAWLACAAFTLWFLLLVDKAVQRLRGKAPQPPKQPSSPPARRTSTAASPCWRNGRTASSKSSMPTNPKLLAAGERREEKLSGEISGVAARVDGLQAALTCIPAKSWPCWPMRRMR